MAANAAATRKRIRRLISQHPSDALTTGAPCPEQSTANLNRENCPFAYATIRLHIVRVDAVFKALADASRRKLLDRLHKRNGQTLGELCEHLNMTRQAVTKHLGVLEAANLVAVTWHGREKLHYLNPVPLHEIYERWIGKYERHRLQALSDLKQGLEGGKQGENYEQK